MNIILMQIKASFFRILGYFIIFFSTANIFGVQFLIQPGQQFSLFETDTKNTIPYKLKKTDKSISLIEVNNLYLNKKITFQSKKLKKSTNFILAEKLKLNGNLNVPLIKIDQQNSCLRYSHSISTGKLPKSVRFVDNNRIAVPLLYDNGIDIINIKTGKRKRIHPPGHFMKNRKYGFVETWITNKNNKPLLWVSQMATGYVHVFSINNMKYLQSIRVFSGMPKVIISHSGTDLLYVSNWSGRNISVLSKKDFKFLYHIKVFGHPRGMAFSNDKKRLFVAQYGKKTDEDQKGRIILIDLISQKPLGFFASKGSQRHIITLPQENKLYVSNMAHAFVQSINMKSNKIEKTIKVSSKPNTIVLSKNKQFLFVSCRGTNAKSGYTNKGPDLGRIYFIDTKKDSVKGFVYSGNQPTGLDVSDDGRYLASSDFLDHRVRIYEIQPECR